MAAALLGTLLFSPKLAKEECIFWWCEKSDQLGDMFGILGGNCAMAHNFLYGRKKDKKKEHPKERRNKRNNSTHNDHNQLIKMDNLNLYISMMLRRHMWNQRD